MRRIRRDTDTALADIGERFNSTEKSGRPSAHVFTFESPAALFRVLIPKRWEFLERLQCLGPSSLRGLAHSPEPVVPLSAVPDLILEWARWPDAAHFRICTRSETVLVFRPVLFHVRAREEVRALTRDVRLKLGSALMALQRGFNLGLPVSRPKTEIELARRRLTEMQNECEEVGRRT